MAAWHASTAGISLPPKFSPQTPASLRSYIEACIEFLTSPLVSSLLECHPNDVAVEGPKAEWLNWWNWAGNGRARWQLLVPGWFPDDEEHAACQVPPELYQLLETVDQLAIPRTPNFNMAPRSPDGLPMRGMSPKKSHEVSQMTSLIGSLIMHSRPDVKHIVDVGAGQGYLSRALSEDPLGMDVLALDFSEVQTKGAERRGNNIEKKKARSQAKRAVGGDTLDPARAPAVPCLSPESPLLSKKEGTVTHEMIHISSQTLGSSVARWISSQSSISPLSYPTPVLMVALHACGTLTPDIIRCFLAYRRNIASQLQNWYPAGLAIVGCCYNLMSPNSDFPLSAAVSTVVEKNGNLLLSYNHRSLAAQSPLQWALNRSTKSRAELAIRKVVYRALFGKLAGLSSSAEVADLKVSADRCQVFPTKIGRLRDSAYSSFERFVSEAEEKTGVKMPFLIDKTTEAHEQLTSRLGVLHVLRSRIGPVIESLILVDRWSFLGENTPDVHLVNLFNQGFGSARNVALVVPPLYLERLNP